MTDNLAMKACLDVDYRDSAALAACVLFEQWTDAKPFAEHVAHIDEVEPYVPGQFFRRELPPLLAVLRQVTTPLEAIVVDGYVWLEEEQPGLGARLYEALDRRVPVIGVAKTERVREMHGTFRIPTLLKLVDHLSRRG